MAHKTTPIEGEAAFWERIIFDHNLDALFESINDTSEVSDDLHGTNPMPKNYLHFVYLYTVCCGDRKKLDIWLSDKTGQANQDVHVFKKITPSDEAWAVANVVNQHDGWCKKFVHFADKTNKIHGKSLGKWTSLRTKDSTLQGAAKKVAGRSFAKTGWHKDGEEFYHKAVSFFKDVRKDERFENLITKARNMWFQEMTRRSDNGRKRRRCDDIEEDEQPLTAPTMDWDASEETTDIRSYQV